MHTVNGLRPIEQIRVGDWVLSKPESDGEKSYKPVTTTIEHDFAQVLVLQFCVNRGPRDLHTINRVYDMDTNIGQGRAHGVSGSGEDIVVTLDNPFFVKKYNAHRVALSDPDTVPQWTKIELLSNEDEIETFDDTTASVYRVDWLRHAGTPGIGYIPDEYWRFSEGGWIVDLHARPIKAEFVERAPCLENNSPRVLVPIYHLEVQDNHTYYVGRAGLWAHDSTPAREN